MGNFVNEAVNERPSRLNIVILNNLLSRNSIYISLLSSLKIARNLNFLLYLKIIFNTITLIRITAAETKKGILDFSEITHEGHNFGREILSRYVNEKNYHRRKRLGRLRAVKFYFQLFFDIFIYKIFKILFCTVRPKIILVNELYWFPWSSIIKSALTSSIPCIQYTGCHELNAILLKKITRNNFYLHPTDIDMNDYLDFLTYKSIKDFDIKKYISKMYITNRWFERNQKLQIDYQESSRNLSKIKSRSQGKTIMGVFPHIFWDATSIYGKDLFGNYYLWFTSLLKYMDKSNADDKFWIIKMHPDLIFKSQKYRFNSFMLKNKLKRLSQKFKNIHIIWPDETISTFQLLDLIDICLTCRGTIGIEFALMGGKTITAGTGRYADRGFTIDPKTIDEYFNLLTSTQNDSKLDYISLTLAQNYAKVIFLALPFRFINSIFDPNRRGLYPYEDAISRLTEIDLNNFKSWFYSDLTYFKSTEKKNF